MIKEKLSPWHPPLRVPSASRDTSPLPRLHILKGPKVAQLLRTIIKLRDGHKELSDRMAELTLELKSIKDDYDTLHHGLGIKIECLEKRVEKGNQ